VSNSIRSAYPLFTQESTTTPTPALSAKSLWFFVCHLDRARELNALWHSRFPDTGGGGSRICFAAEANGTYYAAAIWTNPSSPKLPQMSWLMLKRFAVALDRPPNAASRMMGWMIREIAKRLPDVEWLVSYSDPDRHVGTIYKASGWIEDELTDRSGGGWTNRERAFANNEPCRQVQRWLYPMWLEFS
jgi:hypothetical protein